MKNVIFKKNFLLIFFICLLTTPNSTAGIYLKKNSIHEGVIDWTSKMKFHLPEGQFKVIDRWAWSVASVKGRGVTLQREINKTLDEVVELSEIDVRGKWQSHVTHWMQEVFFKDEYDGCYERPEYYILLRKKKGSFFNCFKVRHIDTHKLLYAPDDQWSKVATAIIRKYIRENNIEIPKIMLASSHRFFATSVTDSFYGVFYMINPETFGGPKNNFLTEDTSEYHKANIENFPSHKKYMEDFVNDAIRKHKEFEKMVSAKPKHLLDFSKYNFESINEIKKTSIDASTNTTDSSSTNSNSEIYNDLKALKELYDDGILSKEEFEKAKKAILNR